MRRGPLDPVQSVIVHMGENVGKGPSLPVVFLYCTGSPGSRIQVLQQKLVPAIIRGVGFQQNFANCRF